jgi:predicted N-acetyltransferase YhbS
VSEFEIRPVEATEIRELRAALLRSVKETVEGGWTGDEAADTLHVGGYRDGTLVGFATIVRHRVPGDGEPEAWRIRGIAVDHGHRGYGLGGSMLRRCLEHAAARGGHLVWCRIPAGAFGFFHHFGFRRRGEPFELPGGGPHYLMVAVFAAAEGR